MSAKIRFRKKNTFYVEQLLLQQKLWTMYQKKLHFSLFTVFTDVFNLILMLLANKIDAFLAFEL